MTKSCIVDEDVHALRRKAMQTTLHIGRCKGCVRQIRNNCRGVWTRLALDRNNTVAFGLEQLSEDLSVTCFVVNDQ
jgi:cytochrome P450